MVHACGRGQGGALVADRRDAERLGAFVDGWLDEYVHYYHKFANGTAFREAGHEGHYGADQTALEKLFAASNLCGKKPPKRELDFAAVLYEDAADVYRLTASNEVGTVMGAEVQLRVRKGAPTWFTELSSRQLITPTVVAQTDKLIMIQWEEPAWNGIKPHPAEPYRLQFREGAGAW